MLNLINYIINSNLFLLYWFLSARIFFSATYFQYYHCNIELFSFAYNYIDRSSNFAIAKVVPHNLFDSCFVSVLKLHWFISSLHIALHIVIALPTIAFAIVFALILIKLYLMFKISCSNLRKSKTILDYLIKQRLNK